MTDQQASVAIPPAPPPPAPPATGGPAWLQRLVAKLPGALPLDEAIVSTFRLYGREWRRITLRAFLIFVPGALVVLLIHKLVGEGFASLASILLFYAGVFWLQSIEVSGAAAVREGGEHEPFLQAFRRMRPRAYVLMRGLGLVLLRMLVPIVAFVVALIFVIEHTRTCDYSTGLCRANMAVVWTMLVAYVLFTSALYVRWSLWVPAVVLENRNARSAVRRSVQLTRGNRTRLTAWLMAASLISVVVLLISNQIFKSMTHDPAVQEFLRSMVSDTLAAPLFVLLWTDTFFRLREMQPAELREEWAPGDSNPEPAD